MKLFYLSALTLMLLSQSTSALQVNQAIDRCVRDLNLGVEDRRIVSDRLKDRCKDDLFDDNDGYERCVERVSEFYEDQDGNENEKFNNNDEEKLVRCLMKLRNDNPVVNKRIYNDKNKERQRIRDRSQQRDRDDSVNRNNNDDCVTDVDDLDLSFVDGSAIRSDVRSGIRKCARSRANQEGLLDCVDRLIVDMNQDLDVDEEVGIELVVMDACLLDRRRKLRGQA